MDSPKTFISYCGEDKVLASRLYVDLTARGCDVWQYEASAVPGSDAWDAILERIKSSEFFVVLWSQAASRSKGVKGEIAFAYYRSLNYDTPKVIPLIVDNAASLPDKLATVVPLPFSALNYESHLEKLLPSLRLSNSPFADTPLLDASFESEREFDPQHEAEVLAANLITKHPEVAMDFQRLCAPTKEAQRGHFRVWPPQSILWETGAFREHLKDGFSRAGKSTFFVIFPLNWGMSNGNGTKEKVIVEIKAEFEKVFTTIPQLALKTNRLRLIFQGMRTFDITPAKQVKLPTT
jgi:hypothetical protein